MVAWQIDIDSLVAAVVAKVVPLVSQSEPVNKQPQLQADQEHTRSPPRSSIGQAGPVALVTRSQQREPLSDISHPPSFTALLMRRNRQLEQRASRDRLRAERDRREDAVRAERDAQDSDFEMMQQQFFVQQW